MRCGNWSSVLLCSVLVLCLLSSAEAANSTFQYTLGTAKTQVDAARAYLDANKVTECRNIMWEKVDPVIKEISDTLENHIEIIKDVDIYDLEEVNLSHGDVKRGIQLFSKAKVDVTYAINDMDFERKIFSTYDVIEELSDISVLLPEAEVTFSKADELEQFTEEGADEFSLRVRDIESYTIIKSMNATLMNELFSITRDIATYTFTNTDENNQSITIQSVTKKIIANKDIPSAAIYEIYPDDIPLSSLIFRSAHSTQAAHNRIFLYDGALKRGNIIPVNYLVKANDSTSLSYTLIEYPSPASQSEKITEEVQKKGQPPISFEDIDVSEEKNYLPSIILYLLILVFFLLLLGSLLGKNRVAESLEQYRRRINNLKRNVVEKKK